MRREALKSKVIQYPCDLDKVEIKTQAKRYTLPDRNEMLPRNSGGGWGTFSLGECSPSERGFSTLSFAISLLQRTPPSLYYDAHKIKVSPILRKSSTFSKPYYQVALAPWG